MKNKITSIKMFRQKPVSERVLDAFTSLLTRELKKVKGRTTLNELVNAFVTAFCAGVKSLAIYEKPEDRHIFMKTVIQAASAHLANEIVEKKQKGKE